MEDFRIIYRILKLLQQSMDFEDFDSEGFNAERFGTNPNRFQALLIQLQRAGYIEGLDIVQYIRQPEHIEPPMHPKITLKELEYLQENSMMKNRCHCEGHQGNCARHLIATEPRCTRTVVFFCPFFQEVHYGHYCSYCSDDPCAVGDRSAERCPAVLHGCVCRAAGA